MAGFSHDHMDALNRYREYKIFWDRHRIPGECKDKRMLWTDPGYKPLRSRRRQTASASPTRAITSNKKVRSANKPNGKLTSPNVSNARKKPKPQAPKPHVHVVPSSAPTKRKASLEVPPNVQHGIAANLQSEEALTTKYDQKVLNNGLANLAVEEKERRSSSSSSSSGSSSSDSVPKKKR